MHLDETPLCPECAEPESVDRRDFIRVVGGASAAVIAGTFTPIVIAQQNQTPAPAALKEGLGVRELKNIAPFAPLA